MYVCGPTVYDEPHIGHLRSAYVFEVIRNYFQFSGYKVTFVRNVTDVDDKIIEKARAAGGGDLNEEAERVALKYYTSYNDALSELGLKTPDKDPKASQHIADMVRLIERLIEKKCAYASDGDVYFDIQCFKDYGQLSHQKKEAMLEGVRIDPNEKKEGPLDFALWKKAKEGEPSWDSPWGKGRPGWHIECSAMSMKYLGETFDIHGGGLDLVFPHHENEIAQSECATGKPFAKYWLHHGLITINGHKMSKSLHNYVTLGEMMKKSAWAAEELKFLFLGTHYSAPLDYSEEKMKMDKAVRERFFFFFEELKSFKGQPPKSCDREVDFENAFAEAMNDDFNTPQALAVMHEMVTFARKVSEPGIALSIGRQLQKFGSLFGVFSYHEMGMDEKGVQFTQAILNEIAKRDEAKKKKDFKTADKIRQGLLEKGIALTDLPDGKTLWRKV